MRKLKLLLCFSFFIFSFSFSFGQNWCWGRDGVVNLKADDEGSPIATNRFGSAYMGGQYSTVMILGRDTLTNYADNVFIAKYNSHGSLLWAKQPQSGVVNTMSFAYAVLSDAEDNAYITGSDDGDSLIFGAYNLSNSNGFFVKYSPSGQVLWAENYGGISMAFDKRGNIYLYTNEDTLYKFDENGNKLMGSNLYVSQNDYISSITVDSLSDIYAVGYVLDTFNSGNIIVPFIAKYDSNGNMLWLKQDCSAPSSSSSGYPYSVVTDKQGNAYFTGYFQDTLQFGIHTLIAPDTTLSYALFLAKYNSNGKLLWVKQTEGNSTWIGSTLSVDKYDSIYLSGSGLGFGDSLTFGGKTFINAPGNTASFILKLDTSGHVILGSLLAGGYSSTGLAVDSSGKFSYIAGSFEGDTIFCANDTLAAPSSSACYIAKWNVGECVYNTGDGIAPIATPNPSVLLYPNPSNGLFTISISHPELVSGTQTIQVYNMLGAKVYDGMLKQVQHDYELNLFSQPNGVYLYRVITENGELIGEGKLIIQK